VNVSIVTVGGDEVVLRLSRYPNSWYVVAAHSQVKERDVAALIVDIAIAPVH
jgi:hypothetical protein